MAEEQVASVQLLRNFAPLDAMKRENLAALAKKVSVRTLSAGRVLFNQGDTDKRTVWLVSGAVEVNENERNIGVLRAGTPETRNPLYPKLPRRVTVRAVDDITFLSIESDLLDVMITWDQTGTYEVEELQATLQAVGSDDWMTTILQTSAFHRIPPANIQAIFQRLRRRLARRAPAERAPDAQHRGRRQRAALSDPPEALDARPQHALRRLLRYRPAQLRRRLHPGRARLRCLRADRGHEQRRWAAADARRPRAETLSPPRLAVKAGLTA